ncbi:peroxiredoxin [Dehalogenimonas etheniformans]|uniref:Peroxiredoxin n=1 Tax=Dehalogenimonas etheniformans TaxID=1536648 RepID=A0A2P5P9S7_9CHLR|nr:peroxiredoxin [Dehalogenimonas etheniformans]
MAIGATAPDFTLKDQDGKPVTLSNFRGKKVVLSFHPLAWTNVCQEQMLSLERNFQKLAEMNAVAFGISIDTVPTKNTWAKSLGIKNTRLLSDFWPHGEVSRRYGLFIEAEGFAQRANVVLNEQGKVIFAKEYKIDHAPDMDEVLAAVARGK